jgi:hypothetical protein
VEVTLEDHKTQKLLGLWNCLTKYLALYVRGVDMHNNLTGFVDFWQEVEHETAGVGHLLEVEKAEFGKIEEPAVEIEIVTAAAVVAVVAVVAAAAGTFAVLVLLIEPRPILYSENHFLTFLTPHR